MAKAKAKAVDTPDAVVLVIPKDVEPLGTYNGYTYREKGDGRIEAVKDSDGSVTMHLDLDNAKYYVDNQPPATTLASINPTTATAGGADLTLTCTGTGFTPEHKIVFAGVTQPTTYVSATSLTCTVKPSLEPVAVTRYAQITWRGQFVTVQKPFTFT